MNYMKKLSIIVLALAVSFTLCVPSWAAMSLTSGDQLIRGKKTFEHDAVFKKDVTVEGALLGVSQYSTVFYVDSNTGANAGGYGSSYLKPYDTIDYAINQCTADKGDIIFVMPSHAETITAADGFDADVAGISIIGLGSGDDMPTLTFTATASEVAIGAANVTVKNIRFVPGISEIVIGVSIEAGGDYAVIEDCVFAEPGTATYEFLDAIDLASGADGVRIINNEYYHAGGTGPAHFVEAGNGANLELYIAGNYIVGQFSVAAIWSDTADLRCYIADNDIIQMTADQHCIEFTGNATGMMVRNTCFANAQATSYDPGTFYIAENYVVTANDVSAEVYPVKDDGWAQINATTLTAIEAEATDAIEADNLDHLLALDGATQIYPENAVDDSILAKILTKADPADISDYDNSTDSLEAIADALAAGTGVTTAIDADGLDHLVTTSDGTGAYPASVAADSILAMILGDDNPAVASTYDNQTDSLEALSNKMGAYTFDGGADDEDTIMAHLDLIYGDSKYIADLSLPASPTSDSLAAFIASGGTALGTELADSASIVDAVGHTGAAFHTTGVGYWMEKTITTTETFAASSNVMFSVSGGAIRITSLFGKCTVAASGSPGTMVIEVDATAGADYDSDLSTTVSVDALGLGDTIRFTNAIDEGVLTLSANVGAGQPLSWFADAGDIEQTLSSDGTGTVVWYMTYVPLEAGVTVTAP